MRQLVGEEIWISPSFISHTENIISSADYGRYQFLEDIFKMLFIKIKIIIIIVSNQIFKEEALFTWKWFSKGPSVYIL